MLVGGASLLAVGIVCQVHSDFLCVPGDALVKTVAQTFRLRLARVKTCFDATLVLSALAVSYALLHRVEGVREGTVLGVFLVGWFVGLALPRLRGLRKSCYHWVATEVLQAANGRDGARPSRRGQADGAVRLTGLTENSILPTNHKKVLS